MFLSYLIKYGQWDTWAFHRQSTGIYYAYYLIRGSGQGYPGEGFGVATSTDSIHWTDYGNVFTNPNYNTSWEGTGSIWLNPTNNQSFIINFSNCPYNNNHLQNISFATSNDLINWIYNKNTMKWFNINTEYYSIPGRWDCIYSFKDSNHNLYGSWTATPNKNYVNDTYQSDWGFGKTTDGLNWIALRPPQIIWGNMQPKHNGEVGAIEQFKLNNGSILYIGMFGYGGEMYAFYSNTSPEGAYYPQIVNFNILSGRCYFSRFFRVKINSNYYDDIILVTHQSEQYNSIVYIAPYKLAKLDNNGILRLSYWINNDKMKGIELPVIYMNNTNDTLIDFSYIKPIEGIIIEGIINFDSSNNTFPGIIIGMNNGNFTCICLNNQNGDAKISTNIKQTDTECPYIPNYVINRGVTFGSNTQFRLLLRNSMFEFYFNDILYFVDTLINPQNGIIGRVAATKQYVNITNAWNMTLNVNQTIR